MSLATRALRVARGANGLAHDRPERHLRWLLPVVAAAVGISLAYAGVEQAGLSWERLIAPLAAVIALFTAGTSVAGTRGRVRHLRLWITLAFAGWTASQLASALDVSVGAISTTTLSVGLLGIVLLAAAGAYQTDLHGRVSRREEFAIYLDAAILGVAVTALVLAAFGPAVEASPALAVPMIHAIVFLAILVGTLMLDLVVLAQLRMRGAYAILVGLAGIGFGFVGRSAVDGNRGLELAMTLIVSAGVLVVAFGTATWTDQADGSLTYARVAERMRRWMPLAAVAITPILLFVGSPSEGAPMHTAIDLAVAFVLVATVARQTLLLADRGVLLMETRRWGEQLERIEALSRRLSRSRAVGDVATAVVQEIESVIDWHGVRFYVLATDGETLEAVKLRSKVDHYAHETPDLVRLRLGHGLGGNIALSGVAEIVNDAVNDPRMARVPGTQDVDESMIVVPLVYEDRVLGVIELFRLGLNAFDPTDLRLAQIVGAQAAVAVSNARQLEELERRSDLLARRLASQRQLLAITERLLVHREQGAVFDAIADTLADVVPHDTLTIYQIDRTASCLVPILARDEYAEQILATRPPLGSGITGDVIRKGEAEIINDAANDPRVVHVPGTPSDEDESMIVAPIRSAEGVIGALNLYRAHRHFDADDLELVRLFTNHVAIALENAAIHDQLVDAAVTDPLTSLPNRRLFAERIDQAMARCARSNLRIAVLFLDLDRFKMVNDGLGHAAGDAVLRAAALRLRGCTRSGEMVARLGGDEFGVLVEDIAEESEAFAASQRLIDALAAPLVVDGRAVTVRASIGVAISPQGREVSSVELLRDADTAMYRAKAQSGGRFVVFDPSMHAGQIARFELDGELRQAIDLGQLALVYQPIVNLKTRAVVAAEALLRWRHPTVEIGPAEFIKLAEESGQIVQIGRWVLREACAQARRWQMDRAGGRKLGLSVNTSARELVEAGFVEEVDRALSETGLPADALTLEITESVMLADETTAIAALRRLRAMGVHVGVDDFGTGYSSLSYLKRLPVDGLKIDRSFIDGLEVEHEKSAIVQATIAFAQALGLTVTAEGIETDAQLAQLIALNCEQGQGYRFAVPLEPSAMTAFLDGSLRASSAA